MESTTYEKALERLAAIFFVGGLDELTDIEGALEAYRLTRAERPRLAEGARLKAERAMLECGLVAVDATLVERWTQQRGTASTVKGEYYVDVPNTDAAEAIADEVLAQLGERGA